MDKSFDTVLVKSISDWLGTGSINIFGRPFAGKDTQCKKLAELLNGKVIGGGDITRNQGSKNLKQQTEAGFLAPTEEYKSLVLPYFNRKEFLGRPLILNSVGRWVGEEKPVVEAAMAASHDIKAVIFINTDTEIIWQRWTAAQKIMDRGDRHDDDREKLYTRLNEFQNKTLPVIEFYKNLGLLIEIDGEKTVEEVTAEILEKLNEFTKSHKI